MKQRLSKIIIATGILITAFHACKTGKRKMPLTYKLCDSLEAYVSRTSSDMKDPCIFISNKRENGKSQAGTFEIAIVERNKVPNEIRKTILNKSNTALQVGKQFYPVAIVGIDEYLTYNNRNPISVEAYDRVNMRKLPFVWTIINLDSCLVKK